MVTHACAAIIIAYNSGGMLAQAVHSALDAGACEVVVVDNNSVDAACEPLRRMQRVRLICLARNVGFALACNVGLAATSSPYVLFLNDDATIATDYIERLVHVLQKDPGAASAQGKLTYEHNHQRYIDSAGLRLDRWALRPMDRGQGELDQGQYDQPTTVFGPTGAAALYRRAALLAEKPHGFDASLFAYYEDVDLAWRLLDAGWHHRYEPAAQGTHARRGPNQKPPTIRLRAFVNRYTIFAKNERLSRFCRYAPLALSWEAVRLMRLGMRDPSNLMQILRCMPAAVYAGAVARQKKRH